MDEDLFNAGVEMLNDKLSHVRTAINDTISSLRAPIMGGKLQDSTVAVLEKRLAFLMEVEQRLLEPSVTILGPGSGDSNESQTRS